MKKLRIFSLIMAALLTFQCAAVTVYAEPEETTQESAAETTAAPIEVVIPSDFSGDASVTYGCKTLDAAVPLVDADAYHADAKAALAYDLNSDTLIWAQDADVKLYPASLTKIMTAMLVIENVSDLDQVVTVRGETIRGLDPSGSNAALKNGEEMTVRDLLYCLMIPSANDAAMVLAEFTGGDVETFVGMMNARAAELGCTGTNFMNPHGLHDDNHYTTARDMAKIMKAALSLPVFCEIDSTVTYTVAATNLSEARNLKTTNRMMFEATYPNVFDERVISGKTGFTTPAGRCLVTVSQSGSMKLITVIMGAKATYGADGYSYISYGNFEETSELLDFVYGSFTAMQVISEDQVLGDFVVDGGENHAFGETTGSVRAVVPAGSDYGSVRYEYSLNGRTLTAPLDQGETIGVVRVWLDDLCIAQETLYASASVAKAQLRDRNDDGQSDSQWGWILKAVLIIAAVLLVLLIGVMIRNNLRRAAMRRRRRARRRAAAAQRSRQSGSRSRNSGAGRRR